MRISFWVHRWVQIPYLGKKTWNLDYFSFSEVADTIVAKVLAFCVQGIKAPR